MVEKINGRVSAGSQETNLSNVTICSWDVPDNFIARIDAICVFQETTSAICSTYTLSANIVRLTGNVIINDILKFNEEGSTNGMSVTFDVNNSNIIVKTIDADGYTYQIASYLNVYSIEYNFS